jgi:hypothetical protein
MAEEKLQITVQLRDLASASFSKLNATVKGFGTGALGAFKGVVGAVFSLKGALAGLGVALTVRGIKDLITSTADEADELRDLSNQLGSTTEFLSELKFAGSQAGVEIGELEIALRTLRKNLGEVAATGKGEALEALNRLDDATKKTALGSRSLEEKFAALARGIKALPESEKLFVTSKLFGRGGGKLLQIIADDFDKAQAAAKRFGLSISKEAADNADAFNDAIGELGGALKGLKNQVILPLLPELKKFTEALTEGLVKNRPAILNFFADVIEGAGQFSRSFAEIGAAFQETFGAIGNVVTRAQILKKTFIEIPAATAAAITTGVSKFVTGIGADTSKITDDIRRIYREASELADTLDEAGKKGAASLRTLGNDAAESAKKGAGAIRDIAKAQEAAQRGGGFAAIRNSLIPFNKEIGEAISRIKDFQREADVASADYVLGAEARADADAEWVNEQIALLDEAIAANEKYSGAVQGQIKDELKLRQELNDKQIEFASELRQQNETNRQLAAQQYDALAGASAGFRQLRDESTQWGLAAKQAVLDVAGSLSSNLTDGILSVVDGTKSFKEAFRDTAKSILQDIARIIIQTLILKAVQSGLGGIGGAIGGAAKGAVFPGPIEPVRGLASGDVIRPPGGLFRVGEGSKSEAVMPLARTRSGDLGVQVADGSAGGGMVQNIYLTVNYNGTITGEKALLIRNAETVRNLVAEKLQRSAPYREALRTAA